MNKKVATIILNRNLGKLTDKLYRKIQKNNSKYTDIFVMDAGSLEKHKSKYTNWTANSKSIKKNGLRFGRGMNLALANLYEEKKFYEYDYFFLVTNDTIIEDKPIIKKFIEIMSSNSKIAILSGCSKKWGEKEILKNIDYKFFWYIHNNSYFLRTSFIDKIKNLKKPHYKNFLFDGNNFRGFGIESEIILKAYKANMAAAITSKIWIEEDESYLLNKSNLIKTEPYNKNLKLYINEGLLWLKKKYNFNSKWDMSLHVKNYYDKFFLNNKKLKKYKI
tara:strand:+ start:367 stop:1194 length:828 start_codon:yes stop_codon:yes gene_type:complete